MEFRDWRRDNAISAALQHAIDKLSDAEKTANKQLKKYDKCSYKGISKQYNAHSDLVLLKKRITYYKDNITKLKAAYLTAWALMLATDEGASSKLKNPWYENINNEIDIIADSFKKIGNDFSYFYEKFCDENQWYEMAWNSDLKFFLLPQYVSIAKEYVDHHAEEYVKGFSQYSNHCEAIVGWYDWFSEGLFSDFNITKGFIEDIVQEYTFQEVDLLPESADSALQILSYGDVLIDVAKSFKKYYQTGDGWTAYKEISTKFFGTILKEGDKLLNKKMNLKYLPGDKMVSSVLIKTIAKMPGKWIEGIQKFYDNNEGTAGSIVADTTVGAFVEATADVAKPFYIGTTAVTYPIVDQICEAVGYDLSSEYEKITEKKGLNAVFQAQKELWVDIVYDEAKKGVGKAIDKTYDAVAFGWKNWKAGMKSILKR